MHSLTEFNRDFFTSKDTISRIGGGEYGGKASGLIDVDRMILSRGESLSIPRGMTVSIPRSIIVGTEFFDSFMKLNHLAGSIDEAGDLTDERIVHRFLNADIPSRLVGDLRALAEEVHTPLAIRSSSLLEDALDHPFAGVYATKMIPNNSPDPDTRYRRLVEAIKFVYASTFFRNARIYRKTIGRMDSDEKMAVIIQNVIGQHRYDRYYPTISGVARSVNYYPSGNARAEDGVVHLALGLGKTIVDGGVSWIYAPSIPTAPPPFNSVNDILKLTQTEFWAVDMGHIKYESPERENEYLVRYPLKDAEYDGMLAFIASTYDGASDRIIPGLRNGGPRVLDFSPILTYRDIPLNDCIRELLTLCESLYACPVEMEFAVNAERKHGIPAHFSFLQVRPMATDATTVEIASAELTGTQAIIGSTTCLGNGRIDGVEDIVYAMPELFEPSHTSEMAAELDRFNRSLLMEARPYILIGFGRWGSSDPWLGIPVVWSNINGARVIVESSLPRMAPEMSQGSHFFHNLTSFHVPYFTIRQSGSHHIDWEWLESNTEINRGRFIRHVRADRPLIIRVDGRTGRGVIETNDA